MREREFRVSNQMRNEVLVGMGEKKDRLTMQ